MGLGRNRLALLALGDASKIAWLQSGVPADSREHSGSDFHRVVKGEDVVGPTVAREHPVGAALADQYPPNAQ